MKRTLRDEIQQTKPFPSLEEEVHIQVLTAANAANRVVTEALRASELSISQFNVLRILRGARPEAMPAGRIGERMVNRDPDLTRLLDRLEANGLVEKSRDTRDRRVVNVRITPAGLEVVEKASRSVSHAVRGALGSLGSRKLGQLADLLEQLRVSAREHID